MWPHGHMADRQAHLYTDIGKKIPTHTQINARRIFIWRRHRHDTNRTAQWNRSRNIQTREHVEAVACNTWIRGTLFVHITHTHTGRHTYRREERSGTARALLHTGASPLKLFLGRRFYATRSCRVSVRRSYLCLHCTTSLCVCVWRVSSSRPAPTTTPNIHTHHRRRRCRRRGGSRARVCQPQMISQMWNTHFFPILPILPFNPCNTLNNRIYQTK